MLPREVLVKEVWSFVGIRLRLFKGVPCGQIANHIGKCSYAIFLTRRTVTLDARPSFLS